MLSYQQLLSLDRVSFEFLNSVLDEATAKMRTCRRLHERCRSKKKMPQFALNRTKAIQFKNHVAWLLKMKQRRFELGFNGKCTNVTIFDGPDLFGGCEAREIRCGMCLCHVEEAEVATEEWSRMCVVTGLCLDCDKLDLCGDYDDM